MYTGMRLAMRAIIISLETLDVAEHPPGQNRGEIVTKLLTNQHGSAGMPWCAAFAAHCYEVACRVTGKKPSINPGLSTSEIANKGKEAGIDVKVPACGDFVCFKGDAYGTGYNHTAVCLNPPDADGWYVTIEGNKGNAVTRCRHHVSEPATFIDCEG